MSKIMRFDSDGPVVPSPGEGEWVKYEDYQALQEKYLTLVEAAKEAGTHLHKLQKHINDLERGGVTQTKNTLNYR